MKSGLDVMSLFLLDDLGSNVKTLDLFMSFDTIFWDNITIFWDENWVNKLLVIFSVKNHNKFSSQNIVILSRNNVPKYCNKGHEQVLGIQNIHFWLQGNKKAKTITIYVHNTYKEIFTRGFKNMSPTKVTLSYDKTKKSPWFISSYREPLVEVVHIWHRST